ncbi:hypothetical protein CIB95_10435 [Lottiidibacillus patelloidae]|uniref:Uncharacterized protein n=1 Tax=Lottiidibacillus patelloidae TaxID=2670334 RepID=A0A263BSD9_9BACI|nr:YiiX/YebB-like N1pC/P60 family cysteine hydrolase [Lottiidibacillus patelloidae]OZM56633.1 hypothetical protein CIB95_10435 [Lottiidibacillus patelloidae]
MGTTKFNNLRKIPYLKARDYLRTGDILFCSGEHIVSKLIRKFSNSNISHVGIIVKWNSRVLLLESVEDDGVRIIPFSQYVNNYENSKKPYAGKLYIGRHRTLHAPTFNKEDLREMLGKAADLLNRKYDKNEITKIISRIALGLSSHKDDDEYICSEFVDICFDHIGIKFDRDKSGFIFPEHIAKDENVKALFEVIN